MQVVAGALYDGVGRVLIAQRPVGKALAGRWEFPGGKLHPGEDAYPGLVRELREELGVEALAGHRLMYYPVAYPDRTVWLDVWIVTRWQGAVAGLDGQALAWVPPLELAQHDILEADAPIVAALSSLAAAARR